MQNTLHHIFDNAWLYVFVTLSLIFTEIFPEYEYHTFIVGQIFKLSIPLLEISFRKSSVEISQAYVVLQPRWQSSLDWCQLDIYPTVLRQIFI